MVQVTKGLKILEHNGGICNKRLITPRNVNSVSISFQDTELKLCR